MPRTSIKDKRVALEALKEPHKKAIDKIDSQIKKLQSKCKHENSHVWVHERATAASMWDGSRLVFGIKCNDCNFHEFVYPGSSLFQFCNNRTSNK